MNCRRSGKQRVLLAAALMFVAGVSTTSRAAEPSASSPAGLSTASGLSTVCVAPGAWVAPGSGPVSAVDAIARAARARAVLLGENHDSEEHHRFQLQVIAALHAQRPGTVIGLEMLPRSAQPVLDRWVAGAFSEQEFVRESDWRRAWGFDFSLYAPVFHFARMNRIPMLALNIDRALVRKVGAQGFDALTPSERGELTRPALASPAYLDRLYQSFASHDAKTAVARDAPPFLRFVEAQQLWDRAMAQAIAGALSRSPDRYVVSLIGSGHVVWGDGVARQLADLGVQQVASLLPWERDEDCRDLRAGLADAVFGLVTAPAPARFRLGLQLGDATDGVGVSSVVPGSAAAAAGMRSDDVLVEAAGVRLVKPDDLIAVIERAAEGFLLPLRVLRQGAMLDLQIAVPVKR